jgi:hypothetical protein
MSENELLAFDEKLGRFIKKDGSMAFPENDPLSSKPNNDHFADKFPTADELAMLREAYAEIYPVRPLLNEIERLRAALEKIAATTWAWEGIEIAREALKLP